MVFEELLDIVDDEPVFETGPLLVGDVDPGYVRVQLSRWVASERLIRLRRGLYALAEPWRKVVPHPCLLANRLMSGSYVSLQSALAHHGLIPEHVPLTTSVTTRHTASYSTPLGGFLYRHIRPDLFWGFERQVLTSTQEGYVALPEKALLDLVHLAPGGATPAYLQELRLQRLGGLDIERMRAMVERARRPKFHRALAVVEDLVLLDGLHESL